MPLFGSAEPENGEVPGSLQLPTGIAVPVPRNGTGFAVASKLTKVLVNSGPLKSQNAKGHPLVKTVTTEATELVTVPKLSETTTATLTKSAGSKLAIVSALLPAPETTATPLGVVVPFSTWLRILPLSS